MAQENPQLSIALPYLSASRCIDTCLRLIERNTTSSYEVVPVVDCRDVYAAYNRAASEAKGDVLVFLNDDMFVAPGWDELLVSEARPKTIVTTYLVESGRIAVNGRNIDRDFGRTPEEFRYEDFCAFVSSHAATVPATTIGFGWYMPFAVRREDFIPFPFETDMLPSDTLLFGTFGSRGYAFRRVRSYAYHFQRMSDWSS